MIGVRTIDWHAAYRPAPGEDVCGDRARVYSERDPALIVVVDGVGRGAAAALAAERALTAIDRSRLNDVATLAQRCHAALGETRGAALSLAAVNTVTGTLTWTGVGNVEGRVLRARPLRRQESLLLARGVAGSMLPTLRPATLRLERGDLVILATDGVDPAFADGLRPSGSCAAIAKTVLARHARPADDALVLVVRYLGGAA